jgi:ribosome-associated protein
MKTLIEQSLDADKAEDIVTIQLDDQGGLADYMIVASGTSSRHVSALADKLMYRLSLKGVKNMKAEGLNQSDWVAIDAGDVIVHIFRPEVRSFYNLEKMWGSFPVLEVVPNQMPA